MKTVERKAVRAILLTPDQEVLLIKVSLPDGSWTGWITPGGGIDGNESDRHALERELSEELGLTQFAESFPIWKRFHSFQWVDQILAQHENYYLIRTKRFTTQSEAWTEIEKRDFVEMRWWKISDIAKSQEIFAPRKLAALLENLVQSGVPPSPIDAGI